MFGANKDKVVDDGNRADKMVKNLVKSKIQKFYKN